VEVKLDKKTMINRTKEIQRIIEENGYTSYLEIGVGNVKNFNDMIVETKVGVDPAVSDKNVAQMGSDEYFIHNQDTFDLIFIDGLHHADQVERDILNSWNCLNKGGQIVIHDVKPLSEPCQRVPRIQEQWTGDVWRSWYGLKNTYPKLRVDYIDERVGLAILHKSKHKVVEGFTDYETTYREYDQVKGWKV
jgi:SAM-dependent methyltransferase